MAKKTNAPVNTITRDMNALCEPVGNIYETVRIVAKRANQIATDTKKELDKKLAEFQTVTEGLEEVFDNREQVEISRYYEQQPKPTLQAIQEFEDGDIYWKNPADLNYDEDGAE